MVAGYSFFLPNRVHHTLKDANQGGFKLPIWTGSQGMHMTMALRNGEDFLRKCEPQDKPW